jgi:hypothetical protein
LGEFKGDTFVGGVAMLDDAWFVVVFVGDLNEETLRLVFRYGLVMLLP